MGNLLGILIVMLVLFAGYGLWVTWSYQDWIGMFVTDRLGLPKPEHFSASTTLLLSTAFLVQAGLLIWALQTLRQAFHEIALHDIVGTESARLMRLSGVAFLANAVAMVLAPPLVSLIVSLDMPAGHRFMAITVSTAELLAVMVSGILIVFGHLLAVAAEVDDDNKRFV